MSFLGAALAALPLCAQVSLSPGEHACRLDGWPDREVIVHVPPGGGAGRPLLLNLHGGGGRKERAVRATCPAGDTGSAGCMTAVTDRRAIVVVTPDGTARWGRFRSWNAGGGEDGWRCTGGRACAEGVDDVAFTDALVASLTTRLGSSSVHATGMSNGAAMAHRLACDGRVHSIVAVSGANQAQGAPGCEGAKPVAVLQIHGTDDPCWGWDGTVGTCLQRVPAPGFVGVGATMEGWSERLRCRGEPVTEVLPVRDPSDPTRATRAVWQGCDAPLALVRIDGGGHAWPDGWAYLPERRIGAISRQLSGAEFVAEWVIEADARVRKN